jgi:hypothetical protein
MTQSGRKRFVTKRGLARFICVALFAGFLILPMTNVRAQSKAANAASTTATEDKDGCIRNLKIIYEAIQAYRLDHKDLPNWLSDLVPQYITDANVLVCPACKRSGQAETTALADPKIPSSYYFEFCPLQFSTKDFAGGPTKTRREWKRRQMGLVGSVVPLVRCRHHGKVLNLGFDGRIYESGEMWEALLTNEVNVLDLTPARMFAGTTATGPAKPGGPGLFFLQRSRQAKQDEINLTDFYNAMLTQSWNGIRSNDLSSLPTGLQTFAGVEFDVRGLIQLNSKSNLVKRFPAQMKGIPIRQKCARLHFLHAAAFADPADDGLQVGSYVVHFGANKMQLEIPIICGRDVRDWHVATDEKPGPKELLVAWTGTNAAGKVEGRPIRLFMTTWENVAPDVPIDTIDFVSAMVTPAPFLVAITAE